MGVTAQVGMANGVMLMAVRLSLLQRVLQRLRKWWQTLRQLSVLLLWLLPVAVALAQQARQYLRHQRSRLQDRGLEMFKRSSQLLQQSAQTPLSSFQQALRLMQQAPQALQLLHYSLAVRLLSRPLALRQAAGKLGSALQQSALRAWSRLTARSSGKANPEPAQAGQSKQT